MKNDIKNNSVFPVNILITGGAGFIGSNFIRILLNKYKDYSVINVDKLTYCGNLKNLEQISENHNYKFINGDICDGAFIEKIISEEKIDTIINFAAESSVDRTMNAGEDCLQTNINGIRVLLDICKSKNLGRFIQISTDEVYGSIEENECDESYPLNPSNIYSISKAAADFLCLSYYKTYNIPVTIIRPVNNFGPYQFPEKIISRFITNLLQDKSVPLYGDGQYMRDWLYVEDTCNAIDIILHKSEEGEIYNVSGGNLLTNLELTNRILKFIGKSENMIEHIEDRPGHDRRYSLDSGKVKKLGWKPICDFLEFLKYTIHWYENNQYWWEPLISKVKLIKKY